MKVFLFLFVFLAFFPGYFFLQSLKIEKQHLSSQLIEDLPANDPFTFAGPKAPEEVNVIIEIEKDTRSRYVYNSNSKSISLSETSFYPLSIPGDYGIIPSTFGRDQNPLGVIVLSTDSAPPGTLINVKPIAVLVVEEESKRRSVIIGVPIADIRYKNVFEIADLQKDTREAVVEYLNNIKTLHGRPAKLLGYEKSDAAKRVVELGMEAYEKNKDNAKVE
jgi:inorganic pyrophosphatase